MATVAILFGIIVQIHFNEHNPPHIHAWFSGKSASFYISSGEIMEGSFPKSQAKTVKEFILCYQKELMDMWNNTKKVSILEKK